jgi:hypothetical protein
MWTMPVDCAEHPPDIIEPAGMVIVNSMSWPNMLPVTVPCIIVLGMPEKLTVPETLLPFCASCHVIVPIAAWPIMPPLPSVELVESEGIPVQFPVTVVVDEVGPVGDEELPPQAAAIRPTSATVTNLLNICCSRVAARNACHS